MKTALFLCILIGAVLVLGGCAEQTNADVAGYGTNRGLSLAFRVVLAVGAATRQPTRYRKTYHRQVGSSPTISWPARTAGIAMVGEATCGFKLACPRKGHAVCRSNATGPRLARCWFWEIDPMPLQGKRAPLLRSPRYVFPENGTDPSRFRNGIPRRRWLVAVRKLVACPLLTVASWKNSNHFIVSHSFSSPCFSPVVLARRNPPPPQPPPNLSLPWTEKVVTASRPLYISEAVGLRSDVRSLRRARRLTE